MPEAKFTINASDKTKKAFMSIRKSFGGMNKDMLGLKSTILSVAGAGGLGYMIKGAIDAGDRIDKLSTRLGASTEALSQYQHVAELSGVSFDNLTMGWQRMTRRVAEAANGSGEAKNALQELGLSAQTLKRLAPEQQFEALADAFSNVDSQSDKVRLSMKLFDSSGVSLLQTMEGGSAAIQKMRREADALGKTLSSEQAKKMAQTNDAFTKLQASIHGVANTIAIEAGPSLVAFSQSASETLPSAIKTGVIALEEFKSGYYDVGIAIHEALTWRDEWDKKILSSVPGGESFMEKHFGYDPDLVGKRKEQLNHLMMLRDQTNKRLSNIETGDIAEFNVPDGKGFDDLYNTLANKPEIPDPFRTSLESAEQYGERMYELARIAYPESTLSAEEYGQQMAMVAKKELAMIENSRKHALQWSDAWTSAGNRFASGIGDATAAAIMEQKNFGDSMNALARGAASQVISSLVEIGVKKVAMSALSRTLIAEEVAVSSAAAATTAAAWAPAAAATSVASFGSAAAIGGAALLATLALAKSSFGGGSSSAPSLSYPRETLLPAANEPLVTRESANARPVQQITIHVHGDIDDLSKLSRSLRPYNIELNERDII